MTLNLHIHAKDVHIHQDLDKEVRKILCAIQEKQDFIISKISSLMKLTQEKFDKIVADLDTVSNDMAADYAQLLAEIAANNITDESVAKAEANIEKLKALGASVENPVPPPVA